MKYTYTTKPLLQKCVLILVCIITSHFGFAQQMRDIDFIDFKRQSKPLSDTDLAKNGLNNTCATATVLTIDGGCTYSSTNGSSLQTGETTDCVTGGGGISRETDWYRFNTGTLTTVNMSWLYTNAPNYFPGIVVYGPFTAGTGCLPSGTAVHCLNIQNGDPGYHTQLSGLTAGSDYLIQIVGRNGGGGNDRFIDYCVGIYTPQPNNTANSPNQIDQCGTTFNGTNEGYTANSGLSNIDGNAATTCPTCAAGGDVPYAVNNDSYFNFCAATAGTWQVTLNSITNCDLGQGIQMALFRGTPSALTWIEGAGNPQAPGSTWTSATFSVAANECIYMFVDGFAGDMCDYGYTLTNISGGCNLLDISFIDFKAEAENGVVNLQWTTSSSKAYAHYTIERSIDGIDFEPISDFEAAVTPHEVTNYKATDDNPPTGINYYRITHYDEEGNITMSDVQTVLVERFSVNSVYPNPATDVVEVNLTVFDEQAVDVHFYNVTGALIYTQRLPVDRGDQKLTLNIEHLPKGMYFIEVTSRSKSFKSKLILN